MNDKKERGQVAYEAHRLACNLSLDWEHADQHAWAAAEQAVLEAAAARITHDDDPTGYFRGLIVGITDPSKPTKPLADTKSIAYRETRKRVFHALDNSSYSKDADATQGALDAVKEWSNLP